MTRMRSWVGPLAALGLALSGTLTGLAGPGTVLAGAGTTAYAGTVAACTVPAIDVRKGRFEGAAGSRFQTVRAINIGAQACATPGWTRYRFYNRDGLIGFRSRRNPGYDPMAAPVVIGAGETGRSTLSWTDPGPVPRAQCHPRHASGVRVKIAGLTGHYFLRMDVRVCTTKKYRPHGTRISTS
ncbi:hypothetical protein ACT8ZV_15195 [Nocardioides sp. MAHUQ-72]|uniref:hypothetical protein n=1 Tax=unclassified Nocardioides TaxID=2615069 RepID=UPI00361D28F9